MPDGPTIACRTARGFDAATLLAVVYAVNESVGFVAYTLTVQLVVR